MGFVNLLQVLHDLGFIEVMTQHHTCSVYKKNFTLLIESFAVARNSNYISPLGSICFFLLMSGFRCKTNKKETLLFDIQLLAF